MLKQIKLNHQICAVILLCIVLITPGVCGRTILKELYEDTVPYYNQRLEQQRAYDAFNNENILLLLLQPPLKRFTRRNAPLLKQCMFKLCQPILYD